MRRLSWLAETKNAPDDPIPGNHQGQFTCFCAVVGRETVTSGHTGANAAFYLLGGARVPPA